MNLKKKKQLVARTFNIGAGRIAFDSERIDEIKEAITKQDMRDLLSSGVIFIKEVKGRRKEKQRKRRKKGPGKIKKKIKNRKQRYVKITRKLREFVRQLKLQGRISKEDYKIIRKQIRARMFRSKEHMNELIKETGKLRVREEKQTKSRTKDRTKVL